MKPPARAVFAPVSQYMRMWDFAAAQRIDGFIANSRYVADRIWKCYRRPSTVIYPPVDTHSGYVSTEHDGFYLSVGRLVAEKRVDLLIAACNRLERRLRIVGTGPEERVLRRIAGPTIAFCGRVDDAELGRQYARCRGLIFAADEDFGLVPLEAQSFGKPVIALGRGGLLETVIGLSENGRGHLEGPTGVFFHEQSEESLIAAMLRFESVENRFDPDEIQRHAYCFDTRVFIAKMRAYVDEQIAKRTRRQARPALAGVRYDSDDDAGVLDRHSVGADYAVEKSIWRHDSEQGLLQSSRSDHR